jgi:hypothetical protein
MACSASIPLIISVHVPKSAGTSLLHIYKQAFGQQAILMDNADDPCDPTSTRNLDPIGYFSRATSLPEGCRIVHGHFHPGKYAAQHDAFRLTFLRDPIDTMLSIHAFWQDLAVSHPLHTYFKKQQLGVCEMARLPLLKNMLSRSYFENIDLASFDFIGRYEHFQDDVKRLSGMLGIELDADVYLNKTPRAKAHEGDAIARERLRAKLRDILIDDVRFYEHALSRYL